MMKRVFGILIAAAFLAAAPAALANFHLFKIDQLFSNADGSVQFVVMNETGGANGENFLAGQSLISSKGGGNLTFAFPTNLPSGFTAGKRMLIATPGFAALGIVTPDYIIPTGFLSTSGGTLTYSGGDQVTYLSLPADGTHAINRGGSVIPNVATNFAGQSGTVAAAPTAITPVGGVWWNPNESGSGYGLDFQNGVLLVQIYSYLAGGPAQWYLAAGPVTNNTFTGTLDRYTGGQCISCAYRDPGAPVGNDGTMTITFTSPTTANVSLPGGRQIQIQRFFQP